MTHQLIFLSLVLGFFLNPTTAHSVDWVHPAMRNSYDGYQKLENRKKNSPDWTYVTNRPQGNIHGGGTVEYRDYKPFYNPPVPRKKTLYKRPKSGSGRNDSCNCPK